ncbi:DUF397 domain-containing protein [Streptomyces sp. NBC_01231]|nr:DUF397 domain-containing protein [Streptomyces sp. NBC_01231]
MTDSLIRDDAPLTHWRKSSYSGPEAGSCLEVRDGHPSGVPVRDSKSPHGPALVFSSGGWSQFVAAVKYETFQA